MWAVFRHSIYLLLFLTTFSFVGCSMGDSEADEGFGAKTVKTGASLEFSQSSSRSAIDVGSAFDYGRRLIASENEGLFSITNKGERAASEIAAQVLSAPFSYKGGAYPGTGGSCGSTLSPLESCTIIVVYQPTEVVTSTVELAIAYKNGRIANPNQTASKTLTGEGYSVSPAFSSITPSSGTAIGGTLVTLAGSYFTNPTTITLGGVPCVTVTVNSSTQLTCVTGAHAAGSVAIALTNSVGLSSSSNGAFTYLPGPTVTAISPSAGALLGNTTVTVTGTGFQSGAAVTVGGNNCTTVTVLSATSLTCVTSAHAAGVVDVAVTNSDTQSGTGSNLYTYQPAPTVTIISPSYGRSDGSTSITIIGTGFVTGATATVGGSTCTSPTFVNSTTMTCTTPSGSAGSANVVVTNADTQAGTGTGVYTYTVGSWESTSTTSAPTVRNLHSNVWTGSKMLIFGGANGGTILNTGAQFDPVGNSWSVMSTTTAPSVRNGASTTWTGSRMLVFGGYSGAAYLNTGGSYDPSGDTWSAITTVNAPSIRGTSATWTGTKMFVFGGYGGSAVNTGACYDPSTDLWITIATTSAPAARYGHSAVWTGSKIIIYGGYNSGGGQIGTGGIYDLVHDSWTSIATSSAASARGDHSALWTGSKMLIFGGYPTSILNTGGSYNPLTDTWTALSTLNAPSARYYFANVWTGTRMIVFGGYDDLVTSLYNSGASYNPSSDVWTAITTISAPSPRERFSWVWSDSKMIVFGGRDPGMLNTGGLYTPATSGTEAPIITSISPTHGGLTGGDTITINGKYFTSGATVTIGGIGCGGASFINSTQLTCVNAASSAAKSNVVVTNADAQTATASEGYTYAATWTAMTTTGAPSVRRSHSAVWTGSKMVIFGGDGTGSELNTGAQYDPVVNSWTAITTVGAPDIRRYCSVVWTGSKMIVFGGSNTGYLNDGGQYDPIGNSWTATATTGAPEARNLPTAVWTGSKMIVFGGTNVGSFNTGGKYDPDTNTWLATTTTNAPSARYTHSAVWTGSRMIVYGGVSEYTGGQYDPVGDVWTSLSTTNAVAAGYHTAVWTGSKMLIFGGHSGISYLNYGGKYDPISDTWIAMSTLSAPSPRYIHTATWTGSKMLIFGGEGTGGKVNTGGEYDPTQNTWTALSTTNAPGVRWTHTEVWTGSKMLIFGGYSGTTYLNTGGIYFPP